MERKKPELNENDQLHLDVATGVVKVIRFVAAFKESGKKSFNIGEVVDASETGNFEADDYVFEFIKDGIVNLKPEAISEVMQGDYGNIWGWTNDYLRQFGHPLSPYQSIEIEDTPAKVTEAQ